MHSLQLLSTALAGQGSLHKDELIKPLVKALDVYPIYYLLVLDWLACVRLMPATLYQQLYLFQDGQTINVNLKVLNEICGY